MLDCEFHYGALKFRPGDIVMTEQEVHPMSIEDQIADLKTAARLTYLKVYDLVFRHGHTTQEDRDEALFLAGHATDLADEMAASVIG
jgi:hypothetical protein